MNGLAAVVVAALAGAGLYGLASTETDDVERLTVAGTSQTTGESSPTSPPEMPVGQPAPALAGPSLLGDNFDIENHRGRYVVVSFTASWCVPCIENLPELVDYAAERSDVTLVSVASSDTATDLAPILEGAGVGWSVLDDQDGTIAKRFSVTGMPTHVVIDPDGRVAATVHGTATSEDLVALTD